MEERLEKLRKKLEAKGSELKAVAGEHDARARGQEMANQKLESLLIEVSIARQRLNQKDEETSGLERPISSAVT